jgi:hypothetical protein
VLLAVAHIEETTMSITDRIRNHIGIVLATGAGALVATAIISPTGASAAPYQVIGTGGLGLNVRTAPSLSAGLITTLADGTTIDIVCQTRGDQVVGSTMWDKIDSPAAGYVADWYTTTPGVNSPSLELSPCPPEPPSQPPTLITPTPITSTSTPTPTPATHTVTRTVCNTQTAAITNWQVYKVCLTGTSSYDGSSASSSVAGVYCNIFAPTGSALGYFCDAHVPTGRSWGSYLNRRLGAREVWLNQRVNRLSPLPPYDEDFSNCVYLRIDTWPNGHISYQNFASVDKDYLAKC